MKVDEITVEVHGFDSPHVQWGAQALIERGELNKEDFASPFVIIVSAKQQTQWYVQPLKQPQWIELTEYLREQWEKQLQSEEPDLRIDNYWLKRAKQKKEDGY